VETSIEIGITAFHGVGCYESTKNIYISAPMTR
jgi:hypothetical protein